MSESDSSPLPGQIVCVRKGRDTGCYAVVVNVLDSRFVEIADGDKRKFDRAKRKNVQHLELTTVVSTEIRNSIHETGRVTNGKLRFAINQFLNENISDVRKDDSVDG